MLNQEFVTKRVRVQSQVNIMGFQLDIGFDGGHTEVIAEAKKRVV